MWIRMLDGPDKGKVQEMKYATGIELITAGRAELHNFDVKPPEVKKAEVSPPPKEVSIPRNKKKK
jgi:hypothetical protein